MNLWHPIRFLPLCLVWPFWQDLSTTAAEVAVETQGYVNPPHIFVTTGDTVTWLFPGYVPVLERQVFAFGGEWSTQPVEEENQSVSKTFTEAGFYAYYTGGYYSTLSGERWRMLGTVTVKREPAAEEMISLAAPVENVVYGRPEYGKPLVLMAAVNLAPQQVERVEFFAEANLVGVAASFPYRVSLTELVPGEYSIAAQVIDREGHSTWTKAIKLSLHQGIEDARYFSFMHLLPSGHFICHAIPAARRTDVYRSPDLSNWSLHETISSERVFIDEKATSHAGRFYSARPHPLP